MELDDCQWVHCFLLPDAECNFQQQTQELHREEEEETFLQELGPLKVQEDVPLQNVDPYEFQDEDTVDLQELAPLHVAEEEEEDDPAEQLTTTNEEARASVEPREASKPGVSSPTPAVSLDRLKSLLASQLKACLSRSQLSVSLPASLPAPETSEEARLKCDHCSRYFTKEALALHLHSELCHTAYQCPQCSCKFGSKAQYTLHICIPEKKKKQCPICSETFIHDDTFLNHTKQHLVDDNVIQCSVCSQEFSSNRKLVAHLMSHRTLAGDSVDSSRSPKSSRLRSDQKTQAGEDSSGSVKSSRLRSDQKTQAGNSVDSSRSTKSSRLRSDQKTQASDSVDSSGSVKSSRLRSDKKTLASDSLVSSGSEPVCSIKSSRLCSDQKTKAGDSVDTSESVKSSRLHSDQKTQPGNSAGCSAKSSRLHPEVGRDYKMKAGNSARSLRLRSKGGHDQKAQAGNSAKSSRLQSETEQQADDSADFSRFQHQEAGAESSQKMKDRLSSQPADKLKAAASAKPSRRQSEVADSLRLQPAVVGAKGISSPKPTIKTCRQWRDVPDNAPLKSTNSRLRPALKQVASLKQIRSTKSSRIQLGKSNISTKNKLRLQIKQKVLPKPTVRSSRMHSEVPERERIQKSPLSSNRSTALTPACQPRLKRKCTTQTTSTCKRSRTSMKDKNTQKPAEVEVLPKAEAGSFSVVQSESVPLNYVVKPDVKRGPLARKMARTLVKISAQLASEEKSQVKGVTINSLKVPLEASTKPAAKRRRSSSIASGCKTKVVPLSSSASKNSVGECTRKGSETKSDARRKPAKSVLEEGGRPSRSSVRFMRSLSEDEVSQGDPPLSKPWRFELKVSTPVRQCREEEPPVRRKTAVNGHAELRTVRSSKLHLDTRQTRACHRARRK